MMWKVTWQAPYFGSGGLETLKFWRYFQSEADTDEHIDDLIKAYTIIRMERPAAWVAKLKIELGEIYGG
jgi:hypothetical protein